MNNNEILKAIEKDLLSRKDRSAWNKGVTQYALELISNLREYGYQMEEDEYASRNLIKKAMLNGASGWNEYSYGGCAFVYDSDIAERLCNPTELKRTRYGERRPNHYENWLDVQYRALVQAESRIMKIWHKVVNPDR